MALFDNTSFRIMEQGLQLLSKQQQVIANNIANQDTPDYHAKYLYFAGVLKEKSLSLRQRYMLTIIQRISLTETMSITIRNRLFLSKTPYSTRKS